MSIKYSVVISYCCNRKTELISLLDSIQKQTILPDEVIVVSDGNAKELYDLSFDIILIEAEKLKRPAPLRNKGIKASKNQYVFISDDDDVWHPNKAEIQLEKIKKHNASLCFTEKKIFKNSEVRDFAVLPKFGKCE